MTEDKLPPEEESADIEVKYTTREDYIRCACDAMNAADNYNPLTQIDSARVKRIKWRCLVILDEMTAEMYDELKDDRAEEPD